MSTSGIVPNIRKLAQERFPLRLAISLHAPTQELRSRLMPINEVYPLDQLIEACRDYQALTERHFNTRLRAAHAFLRFVPTPAFEMLTSMVTSPGVERALAVEQVDVARAGVGVEAAR